MTSGANFWKMFFKLFRMTITENHQTMTLAVFSQVRYFIIKIKITKKKTIIFKL